MIALAAAFGAQTAAVRASEIQSDEAPIRVQVQGKVVCLAEEMHKLYQADLPSNHQHIYGFTARNGKVYTLLRSKLSEALFVDKRLLEKELILKGRVFPKTQVLDVLGNLQSVRRGVVCELYYYCDVCSIQTIVPGPCLCCQDPVKLVERPRNASSREH